MFLYLCVLAEGKKRYFLFDATKVTTKKGRDAQKVNPL